MIELNTFCLYPLITTTIRYIHYSKFEHDLPTALYLLHYCVNELYKPQLMCVLTNGNNNTTRVITRKLNIKVRHQKTWLEVGRYSLVQNRTPTSKFQ